MSNDPANNIDPDGRSAKHFMDEVKDAALVATGQAAFVYGCLGNFGTIDSLGIMGSAGGVVAGYGLSFLAIKNSGRSFKAAGLSTTMQVDAQTGNVGDTQNTGLQNQVNNSSSTISSFYDSEESSEIAGDDLSASMTIDPPKKKSIPDKYKVLSLPTSSITSPVNFGPRQITRTPSPHHESRPSIGTTKEYYFLTSEQSNQDSQNAKFGIGEHLIGPTLIWLGYPRIPTRGKTGGATLKTSVASKYLDMKLENTKLNNYFKKAPDFFRRAPTGIPKIIGGRGLNWSITNSVGRYFGRWVPFIGWGITAYDIFENRAVFEEFVQGNQELNEAHKCDLLWHVH